MRKLIHFNSVRLGLLIGQRNAQKPFHVRSNQAIRWGGGLEH